MPSLPIQCPGGWERPDSYHLEQTDNMLKMSGSSMSVGRESRAGGGLFGHPFEAHDLLTKMTGQKVRRWCNGSLPSPVTKNIVSAGVQNSVWSNCTDDKIRYNDICCVGLQNER